MSNVTAKGEKSTNGRIPKAQKVASEPTIAQLKKAAGVARKAGVTELAEKYEGVAEDAAGRTPKMTQAEQSAEFEKVAREHGAEGSEAEFNGVLRKLAKAKPPA